MTRFTTGVWVVAMGVVGVAQLFRTTAEQVVGVIYIIGAAVLSFSLIRSDQFTRLVGLGIIATGCASRAIAGLTLAVPWHSTAIIEATWGLLAFLAYQEARRVIRDVR